MTIQRIDRTAPQEQGRWRREVLGSLSGTVLDVGAGSGASADFLPAGVTWLALEPAPSRRLEGAGSRASQVTPAGRKSALAPEPAPTSRTVPLREPRTSRRHRPCSCGAVRSIL